MTVPDFEPRFVFAAGKSLIAPAVASGPGTSFSLATQGVADRTFKCLFKNRKRN